VTASKPTVADFDRLDATAMAELVRRGDASPVELVEAAIARIEARDGTVNAVIHRRFERALAEAASPTLPDGPFRGVPFALKDLWPGSEGDPFHLGVKALRDVDHRAVIDTNLVTRYRGAGLVIVGRTNTPELGLVATTEPLAHGPSRNPFDPSRGTGGSSGGAAAAVAAGMVPVANASDGGGSIRIPAAMCGLVGLKPSRGRISMGPVQDEWGVSVQHVVSRTVRDSAALLDVSAGPFPGDGVIAPAPHLPYAESSVLPPVSLRVGLLASAPEGDTHPRCRAAAEAAGRLLADLGHRVDEAHPAVLDDARRLGEVFGVTWSVGAATSLLTLGDWIGRPLTADDVEPSTWALAELGRSYSGVDLLRAQNAMAAVRREAAAWWADGWDLLLTPTTAAPAPPIGHVTSSPDDPTRPFLRSIPYSVFTSVWNVTGQPAISLPAGTDDGGVPLGVQLVGAYGREDLLLQVATQLEAELRWDRRLPAVPA
jgi:amidase